MAVMTVGQKIQAAKNPKHEGWDDPNRSPTGTLEVFRVEVKKYCSLFGNSNAGAVADGLNNGKTSYVHVICDTANAFIFEWVLASDAEDYKYLWHYLETRLKDYNVQRVKYT